MLAGRVAGVGLEHQGEWRESVAVRVDQRGSEPEKELEASDVKRLARTHNDAGLELCAVSVEPARGLDLPLQDARGRTRVGSRGRRALRPLR